MASPVSIALGMLVFNLIVIIIILAIKLPTKKKGGTTTPNLLQYGSYLHDLVHGFYAKITETKDLGDKILLTLDNGDRTRYFKKLLYGPTNNPEVMAGQPAVYIYGIDPTTLKEDIKLREEMERVEADYILEKLSHDEIRNREITNIKEVVKRATERHAEAARQG